MLFEINLGLFLLLIQNLELSIPLSIFISMLGTQTLLFVLKKLRFIFTERFCIYYNSLSLLLQVIVLPMYLYPVINAYLIGLSIEPTFFLQIFPIILIVLVYSVMLFTYNIKLGAFIRRIEIKLTNLFYLGMYICISLIPSYLLTIFITSFPQVTAISQIFYTSCVFLICILVDVLIVHGLMVGPKIWVLNALNKNRNKLKEGLNKKKMEVLERSTGLQLDVGENTTVKLNVTVISEFINNSSKYYGLQNVYEKIFSHLWWLFSVFVNIITITYIIQAPISMELTFTLALITPGALSYITLLLLSKLMIVSDQLRITLYNINFVYNVFSCAIVIFPIIQQALIPSMGILNASILAFDCSAGFAFGTFQILKPRLVERSPGFYYITLFILWTVFASIMIFSIAFAANVVLSIAILEGTVIAKIFTNSVFIAFLTIGFILISVLGAIGYLFKYNILVLRKKPVFTAFTAEELQEKGISEEELNFLKVRGFAQLITESELKKRINILRTYQFRHIVSIITYFVSPIPLFVLGIFLGSWGYSLFTRTLIVESSVVYLSCVLLFVSFDYRTLKFLNRELNNQIRCILWIIFQVITAVSVALLLELTWYGRILLFLQVYSMLMPPLNYFLKNSGFKVAYWIQRSESFTKILMIVTSIAYLTNLTFSTLYSNIHSSATMLFGIAPYLLLFAHLIFHFTYFRKETSLKRYYRTYNRSYPLIMISLYLIRYQPQIYTFLPAWVPFLAYILPIISVGLILFSLFYYYSMVHPFNIILNFLYQMTLLFIGFLFVQFVVVIPFSTQLGYGYLAIDQILISCALTFIIFYYMRKAAYFEIYKGYTGEEPIRFRAVGIIAGTIRTLGVICFIGSVLRILDTIVNFSIARWALVIFAPTQLGMINSTFIWSLASFGGLFLFLFFLKGYFKNFEQYSYNSRFVVRIWVVLAAAIAIGMSVILYEPIYFYALPPLLVLCYLWLYLVQKKNPYRANLTIGAGKSILVFLFVYWILHQYIIGLLFPSIILEGNSLLFIEVFLSAGVTGFTFSRTFQNILIKGKNVITWLILITAVGEICYSVFLILINLGQFAGNPALELEFILSLTLTLNFGILLLYLAVAIKLWKISKLIWDLAWWLWLFLPIINFILIYRSINGVDSITQTFIFFGVEIPGSILLTIIISTLLYLPVILTKFQKAYKFFFFITWIEAIPVWIWLAPNLFSSYTSTYLSPLFVIGLSLISLVPFLFSLKYWRIIAGVWIIIAITNGIFLSILFEVDFLPDIIMDIFIHICVYGLFLIIFLANPVIRSSWKLYDYGILLGFILLTAGAAFLVFGFAFMLMNNILYALSISGFVTGAIMVSGRYVKLIQKRIYPYAIMLIATSIGFGSFIFLFDYHVFPVSMDFSWIFLNNFLQFTLFPFSVALVSSCGIVLIAQAQELISKKRWRLVFAFFALGIGFTVGAILDSLLGFSNPLFAAVVSFWAVLVSYPTFRYKKVIFWGLFPIFLAYSAVYGFEQFNIILLLTFNHIVGINYTFWIFSFSLFSLCIHKIVSSYFLRKSTKITAQLVDMGISDFKTLSFADEETDIFMEQQQQIAQKLIHSLEVLPQFYVSAKKIAYLYSIFYTTMLYSFSYLVAFMVPLSVIYQIQIFFFCVSLNTFLILRYNKKQNIFGNPNYIRAIRFTASNLLYASILYGIIIFSRVSILQVLNFLALGVISPSIIASLNIALDSLLFYMIFLVLSKWIRFYGKIVTLLVKILSWIMVLIGTSLFIGLVTSYAFIIIIAVTLGSYIIVIHLNQYHKQFENNLRLLAKSTSSPTYPDSITEQTEGLTSGEEEIFLGLDTPIPIHPPSQIHHEDLVSETDFGEVKEVLDQLLPGDANTGDAEEVLIDQLPEKEQYPNLEDTLKLISIQERRNKLLKSFIRELDAWVKQGIIIELSYFAAFLLSNLLPGFETIPLYHQYVFRLVFSACFATVFYNIKKLVPESYRLVVVQIILGSLLILTVMTTISIVIIYGIPLKLVGDGIIAPVGQLYAPNIAFLFVIMFFIMILEFELIIWNIAQIKNIYLRKPFIDKWNDILHPILLFLAAFIIANSISINQPFITRFVYASLILFAEAILEKYVLKIFNRLTRARILLYSWIIINILTIIQVALILPSLDFKFTFGILTLTGVFLCQFITLYFYYQLQNEKIVRKYNIDPIVLDHYLFQMISPSSRWRLQKRPRSVESYSNSDKLIIYSKFITPKYSFMMSSGYLLLSFLISAIFYEAFLTQFIAAKMQECIFLGLDVRNIPMLWNNPTGIQFLMLCGLPIMISIVSAFGLFSQDKRTLKVVRNITRNVFLIILWIILSISLMSYAFALIQLYIDIIYSNLIILGMIATLSCSQYYTIYLITDIAIHSAKNMEKLESKYSQIDLETKSHAELMDMLTKIEPKSLRIIKRINLFFAVLIYGTISIVTFIIVYILTSLIVISLCCALLILYAQSELNYFILKAFSSKINIFFSLVSWIIFSLVISLLLPITLWGTNPLWNINPEFTITVNNSFYSTSGLCIFSIASYGTVFILKRILSDYTVKFYWLKYLRLVTYFMITVELFVLFIPSSWLIALFSSSVILYIQMVIERYLPIFLDKFTRLIRSIAAFLMSAIASYWTYIYLENSFNFSTALAVTLLLFTILSQLIFNPWEYKKIAGPIFWACISGEVGFLINTLFLDGILIGIGSGMLLMALYPILFEFNKFLDFFKNIAENLRILYQKIVHFFKNFWIYMRNFYIKAKIPITLIMVLVICVVFVFIIRPYLALHQAIFISMAIASTFLFPIFITPKALKDEKTFSRMVYYSAIIYIFANIAIFSFVRINIVWFLLSLVLFSSILLVVIYRRETLYNLSIRWRFIGLIITILSALVLATILVLFFFGVISINFF